MQIIKNDHSEHLKVGICCDWSFFSCPLDCLLFQYILTHGTKLAEIDFMVFLTIFEYAESNAERCQTQLFMQILEFYFLKLALKIARKSLKNKGVSKV